jgi:hypothetical protein
MCHLLSWIESETSNANGQKYLFYLPYDQIFNTEDGKKLQEYCLHPDDLVGHGAIRYFYKLSDNSGINKECTDFSDPNNFPVEIQEAIKAGKFAGLGYPEGLLNNVAWEEFLKIRQSALEEYYYIEQPAREKYEKSRQPAYEEYLKIRNLAWEEFKKVMQPDFKEYEKVERPAWKKYRKIILPEQEEYEKIRQSAREKYEKIINSVFWKLFSNPKNRAECWK